MPELVLLSQDVPVLRCPLHGQSVRVGAGATNDLSIPDDALPQLLCCVEPLGGGKYRVVDKSGDSLTFEDGSYDHKDLVDGDVLVVGKLRLRFSSAADAASAASPRQTARTGILRTRADGSLLRTDLRVRLPHALGGKQLAIPPDGLRIGASPENDVVIEDGFVSSFHAQLFLRGERLIVRDLDSTNGTFVAGVRVTEADLAAGSVLQVGKSELVVQTEDTVEPVAAPAPTDKGPWKLVDMTSADPAFAKVFTFIQKVAPHDATVCVFGETGTGKELVAQALHKLSARKDAPFLPLNCAAVPQNLIESELFGHEKGAFTGADRLRKGAFEEAHGGTLFLDEVGEVPLDMQAKLLRVLETRQVRRVGGRGDIAVDVRVVTATHRDLAKHVKEGKFREDLLHRLYVIPVKLPALRERAVDIPHLARHFAKQLAPGAREVKLDAAAEKKLKSHPFPGNVRELRNVIQRALIMGDGKAITADDVQFVPTTLDEQAAARKVYRPGMTMEDVEREALRTALVAGGTAAEAARMLGLAKTTFWRRATALGLLGKDPPGADSESTGNIENEPGDPGVERA